MSSGFFSNYETIMLLFLSKRKSAIKFLEKDEENKTIFSAVSLQYSFTKYKHFRTDKRAEISQ
jgi:hypothetical protein